MVHSDLNTARTLFEHSERESDPSRKFSALEEALELVDVVLADRAVSQSDRGVALTLRHSYLHRLLTQLVGMQSIEFNAWRDYIRLLLIERTGDVDVILAEDASLKESYETFISLWKNELLGYQDVLKFWFEDSGPAKWWKEDESFDHIIIKRFSALHQRATRCELFEWRKYAHGRLAEIIVLDQFSRNMFRGSPQSFAHDALALALAQEAISVGADKALDPGERYFLYMPFMHSESRKIHEVAVGLFRQDVIDGNLDYELKHKTIIERFGRYPHRNAILGRESTAEEIEFLKQPGSSF